MERPPHLPQIELNDPNGLHANWKPKDGWNGLVPDKSELPDAIAKLGQPSGETELTNGKYYEFDDGLIRVTVLAGQTCITKIWISGELSTPDLVPDTIAEARKRFGPINVSRVANISGAIFEKPGIRIACSSLSDSAKVRWMEVYGEDD